MKSEEELKKAKLGFTTLEFRKIAKSGLNIKFNPEDEFNHLKVQVFKRGLGYYNLNFVTSTDEIEEGLTIDLSKISIHKVCTVYCRDFKAISHYLNSVDEGSWRYKILKDFRITAEQLEYLWLGDKSDVENLVYELYNEFYR